MTTDDISFPKYSLTGGPGRMASAFVSIHETGGPIRRALLELPTWRAAVDNLNQLPEPGSGMPATTPTAAVTNAVLAALRDGDGFPDVKTIAFLHHRDSIAAGIAMHAMNGITSLLVQDLDDAIRSGVDQILNHLNGQLAEVLAGIADLGTYNDLVDAGQALHDGRGDDALKFSAAATAYADLRAAQQKILSKVLEVQFGSYQHPAHIIRKIEDHHRDYAAARLFHKKGLDPKSKRVRKPWPQLDEDGRGLPIKEASQPAFLAWALHAGAELWIPDTQQLADEIARADAAVAQPLPGQQFVRPDQITSGPMFTPKATAGMRRPLPSASSIDSIQEKNR